MDTCFIASLVSDGGNTGGFSSPSVPQASTIGYTLVIVKLILWIQCSTKGCDTNQTLEVDTQALSGDRMWSRDWGVSVPHKKYISARSTPESPCCTLEKQDWLPGAFEKESCIYLALSKFVVCVSLIARRLNLVTTLPHWPFSFCHLWGPWP